MENERELKVNNELEPDTIRVSKTQLELLIHQNRELKEMTIASGDAILIIMELFGGKLPTNIAQGISLLTKIPKMVENFDEKKRQHLQKSIVLIAENADKYLTPQQVAMIDKYKLKELTQKIPQ